MPEPSEPSRQVDTTDQRIINTLQDNFPLSDEPYREAAERLAISEEELLSRLRFLLEARVLTRFGPMFQVERMGGALVLAAMKIPEVDFERVAGLVNSRAEVAHNYRREHAFNMWFVLATETRAGIAGAIAELERLTGYPVHAFPKEREYFVEMKLQA